MKTTIITIFAGAFLLILLGQCRDDSKRMTYDQAMDFRRNYKRADKSTVRRLFGMTAAEMHNHNDTNGMLSSVAFSKDELKGLQDFFKGKIPDFSTTKPPQNQFDGYRMHVGIDTIGVEHTAVYILTFGKQMKAKHDSVYLQDSLELGIYHFKDSKLDFDKFPELGKPQLRIFTHLSCYPNCKGDKLR